MPRFDVPPGADEPVYTNILTTPNTITKSNDGENHGQERFRSNEDEANSMSSPGQGRQIPEEYLVAIHTLARMSLPTAQTIPDAALREFVTAIIQMATGIEKTLRYKKQVHYEAMDTEWTSSTLLGKT